MTMLAPHHTTSLLGTRSSPPQPILRPPGKGTYKPQALPAVAQTQLDKSHPLRRKHNVGTQHVC